MSNISRGMKVIFSQDDTGSRGSQCKKGTVGYCFWTGWSNDRPSRLVCGVVVRGSNRKVFVDSSVLSFLSPKAIRENTLEPPAQNQLGLFA